MQTNNNLGIYPSFGLNVKVPKEYLKGPCGDIIGGHIHDLKRMGKKSDFFEILSVEKRTKHGRDVWSIRCKNNNGKAKLVTQQQDPHSAVCQIIMDLKDFYGNYINRHKGLK